MMRYGWSVRGLMRLELELVLIADAPQLQAIEAARRPRARMKLGVTSNLM